LIDGDIAVGLRHSLASLFRAGTRPQRLLKRGGLVRPQ